MDIKHANYDAVLDVSLRGTLLMSQAVIPTMRAQKSGSIICIIVRLRPARRRYLWRTALQRGKSRGAGSGAGDGARAWPG